MKKLVVLCFAFVMCFALVGCGGPSGTDDLTGTWKQTNSGSDDSWMEAKITSDAIEINWVSDNGDTTSLYWAGTYEAPKEKITEYSWTSKNDTSKTGSALLASGDETKDFTYKDGVISYKASAMGTTTTVKLEKEK